MNIIFVFILFLSSVAYAQNEQHIRITEFQISYTYLADNVDGEVYATTRYIMAENNRFVLFRSNNFNNDSTKIPLFINPDYLYDFVDSIMKPKNIQHNVSLIKNTDYIEYQNLLNDIENNHLIVADTIDISAYRNLNENYFYNIPNSLKWSLLSDSNSSFGWAKPLFIMRFVFQNGKSISLSPFSYYKECPWILNTEDSIVLIESEIIDDFLYRINFRQRPHLLDRGYMMFHIASFIMYKIVVP